MKERGVPLICLWLLAFGSQSVRSQTGSEESGTVVIVAKTNSVVVVSVDSRTTEMIAGGGTVPRDQPDRKIVNVGKTGACAIDGHLGTEERFEKHPGTDISQLMHTWVLDHPEIAPREAIGPLLQLAVDAWEAEKEYKIYVVPRIIGEPITVLTCGDYEANKPIIVRGHTEEASMDVPVVKIDDPVGGDLLYVTMGFRDSPLEDSPNLFVWTATNIRQVDPRRSSAARLIRKIDEDEKAQSAFYAWQGANSKNDGAGWTQDQIKILFTRIFYLTETEGALGPNFSSAGIGPPNNARVITQCGRRTTTVDGDDWPVVCPPPQTPKKNSFWKGLFGRSTASH
jgi:hypothetical protein